MDAVDFLKEKAADLISISESTLEDVAKNPEKLRALLNLWFVPQFKPTFVPDRKKGAFDFELMGPSIEQPVCAPRRMFDIKTMNLVENVDIDEASQYCVLSHSWKGLEVDYPYVLRARDRDRTMVRAEKIARRDDVTSIKNQCKADLEEKEKETQDSLDEAANQALSGIGLNGSDELIVEKLLFKRISSALVLREFENANKQLDAAKSKLAHAERESAVFKSLAQEMDTAVSSGPPKETSVVEQDSGTKQSAISQKATDVEEAQKILNKAEEAWKATKADREFFEDHSLVREAVDEMSGLLQRWRSAKKIEYSIKRAQEIFNDKSFPPAAKRYIWLDTCCINKTNQGELIDSLSLMGDWYSNAEFCLVHLDTSRSDTEWIEEWHRFKSDTLPEPNITDFDSIREACPEWSTRGWTLQELVLSKTTFYVNSAWKPLDRPVESLGPYYYLCPFIKLYTDKLYSKELPEEKLKQLRIIWKDMAGRAESDVRFPSNHDALFSN
ncbi:hypothetical protein GTA08_BOTSDO12894 [Neofusicoccum parvum]|uniref:Uncharacterized protein n=1 Tax=Neofusicoccum parvum TaxID=310453 RepID=A0ACB5SBQ0_9PEZI|nr:hypothetical protein GTA08_BOTSDO12894 [Neofusicoccum parvum]GME65572.1 hypothetical protein GTA08_BOTSDO12894 [Neofusicoccum parvum]